MVKKAQNIDEKIKELQRRKREKEINEFKKLNTLVRRAEKVGVGESENIIKKFEETLENWIAETKRKKEEEKTKKS